MARIIYTETKPHATVTVEQRYCKGCDLCVRLCPVGALQLSEAFSAAGYHYPVLTGQCTGCTVCEIICPDFAIVVSEQR
ncbi:MAG: 4Fe-4S dicluster domain-containing protein [Chloroflexi bacterium]|nr:4Fe-4S dicluster domain-containing protein [Chloroflexota bacterium]